MAAGRILMDYRVISCLIQTILINYALADGLMVRLVDGPSNSSGRLEVNAGGGWGTVCDDSFSNKAATVACKSMGYRFGVDLGSRYGGGMRNTSIWLDEVQCRGNESSLLDCSHNVWGNHDCGHGEDVSISCVRDHVKLRLVDGPNNSSGRLELNAGGEWGTVCDDRFNNIAAVVACKSMGYKYGVDLGNQYGGGMSSTSIWLDEVWCQGHESSLLDCSHNTWASNDCSHSEDVSISCAEDTNWRLVDGTNNSSGRLEANFTGRWGTVCDDGFDHQEATVACRSMGYQRGIAVGKQYGGGSEVVPVWIEGVSCQGNESSLLDCSLKKGNVTYCWHDDGVSIMCDEDVPVPDGDLNVRLVDGPSNTSGRLEVMAGGEWGTVCHDHFDDKAARVICKTVGANFGIPVANQFGGGNKNIPIWLDDISCRGNESSLLDCFHRAWGSHNCNHSEDVSVACDGDFAVRLAGGNNNSSGRLEVKAGGRWGTVCDDHFDDTAATVACKTLGYNYGIKIRNSFNYGDLRVPIWLDDITCTGQESSLFECAHDPWGTHNCGHYEDVTVTCVEYIILRLADGPNNSSGRLEANLFGVPTWGTVCDVGFDHMEAKVACRSMGYQSGIAVGNQYGGGNLLVPIWLKGVSCQGNESSLLYCSHPRRAVSSCGHNDDVSIKCDEDVPVPDGDLNVRLVDGPSNSSGRLEVMAGGEWGTVCHDHFDDKAASVACKTIGSNFGIAMANQFGGGNKNIPIWLDDISCKGNESSLLDCFHRAWGSHNCNHSEDVSVVCDGDLAVRLVGGPDNSSGRLEVKAGGKWGTVCNDGFDNTAATVACETLGYSYGITIRNSFSGGRRVPILLEVITCTGQESSLFECSHHPWGTHLCYYYKDVAIMCVEDMDLRLVDGLNNSSGRLEANIGGRWGTVCDVEFNHMEAKVACRSMGYQRGIAAGNQYGAGNRGVPIWLTGVSCQGNESSLLDCSHKGWHANSCGHNDDVSIICDEDVPVPDGDLKVRLVDGPSNSSGRLEVMAGGEWGTVCHDHFDDKAASVTCTSIGANLGIAVANQFGGGNKDIPIWLDDISCRGNESSLLDCFHRAWGSHNCNHSEDVGVVCDEDFAVRLVNGPNDLSGRLEVKAGGRWGTVCDDGFDDAAATVACKTIGFNYGVEIRNRFGFGDLRVPIWLDDITCTGQESSLLECSHNPWGTHNCGHYEDVAVLCANRDGDLMVRLVDGADNSSGRLEVKAGGRWGTVCKDGFDNRAALIVCRSIGFHHGITVGTQFGRGNESVPIWLDDVMCKGNEQSLLDCVHNLWGRHNCAHYKDVGVMCGDDLAVRLVGGPYNSTGRLEVKAGGRWGTVCDDRFDNTAATVACKTVGYNYGLVITNRFGSGGWRVPIWIDEITCTGKESSLLECSRLAWGSHNCNHDEDVAVICANRDGDLMVRLVDGADNSSGRLEVKAGGRWGTVCDHRFDERAAKVVCRSIGVNHGITMANQLVRGSESVPIWLDNVTCIGNESSLLDCKHSLWGRHNCGHNEDVGVMCVGNVTLRLVGGPNNSSGRLEVKAGGRWGTVCDDHFDHRAATVACKTFGYNYGIALGNRFGSGGRRVPIWLDDITCTGQEYSLLECSRLSWGDHHCDHEEDVSVMCANRDGGLMVQLVDGPDKTSGRLQVKAGGRWGTVCVDGFDNMAATVACKSIGYNKGVHNGNLFVGGKNADPIWLDDVSCIGHESNLLDCSHGGWGIHNCSHSDDVGVTCGCLPGSYGSNCSLRCSLGCKKPVTCDMKSGICDGGCQQWYLLDTCTLFIRLGVWDLDGIRVGQVEEKSLEIIWSQGSQIAAGTEAHIGYAVKYWKTGTIMEKKLIFSHLLNATQRKTVVNALKPNTLYIITTQSFRVWPGNAPGHESDRNYGAVSGIVAQRTAAISPKDSISTPANPSTVSYQQSSDNTGGTHLGLGVWDLDGIRVGQVEENSLEIIWSQGSQIAAGTEAHIGYAVKYWKTGTILEKKLIFSHLLNATQRRTVVDDLEPKTLYIITTQSFRVWPGNAPGHESDRNYGAVSGIVAQRTAAISPNDSISTPANPSTVSYQQSSDNTGGTHLVSWILFGVALVIIVGLIVILIINARRLRCRRDDATKDDVVYLNLPSVNDYQMETLSEATGPSGASGAVLDSDTATKSSGPTDENNGHFEKVDM